MQQKRPKIKDTKRSYACDVTVSRSQQCYSQRVAERLLSGNIVKIYQVVQC